MNGSLAKAFYISALLFFAILLLYYAQALLIPFVVAVVIWYLILTLRNAVLGIPKVGALLPSWLANLLAVVLSFLFIYMIGSIVTENVNALINLAPEYAARLNTLKDQFFQFLHVDDVPNFDEIFGKFDVFNVLTLIAQAVAEVAKSTAIIFIYVIFLLLEGHYFDQKIRALARKDANREATHQILDKIAAQVQSYVRIKTFVSFLTALSAYVVLVAVGVDFADFWALLFFILNFIPTIGSIIATILPIVVSVVQFESLFPVSLVAAGLITVQMVFGNFIEPRLMGRSFNLSPLVILLSLAIWGYIWGIVGMLLSVPIMVILNIIFSNFEETEPLAILLSEKGEVK